MDSTKPPPDLRLVSGSGDAHADLAARAAHDSEARQRSAQLRPPRGTPRRVRAIWNRKISLVPEGQLIEVDAAALCRWCYAEDLLDQALKEFAASGSQLVITGPDGIEVAAPLLGIITSQMEVLSRLDAALGFTPAARARMARDVEPPAFHWE